MALSNVEKQRRWYERSKQKGFVKVQKWVTPEVAELINRVVDGGEAEASKAAHATLDRIQALTERWGELLEPRRDPLNGEVKQPRWAKCAELWQELAQALNQNIF
jgi:hypothetical protein